LIEQGNQKAIGRKIAGRANGRYVYEKNLEAAVVLNDQLIKEGNEEAIIRKIKGLSEGKDIDDMDLSLYQVNMSQLRSWLEKEESSGTRWACYLSART
jgi:hypothetical protein